MMGVHIEVKKLVIITEPKAIYFDFISFWLSKDVDNNFKYEIDFIIKHNERLAEHTIKNKIGQLLTKYENGNDVHKHRKQ